MRGKIFIIFGTFEELRNKSMKLVYSNIPYTGGQR